MIWNSLMAAKREKKELHVVWLDLANAYGSDYTTGWQALEIGIMMGCVISPLLFVMCMEVIL